MKPAAAYEASACVCRRNPPRRRTQTNRSFSKLLLLGLATVTLLSTGPGCGKDNSPLQGAVEPSKPPPGPLPPVVDNAGQTDMDELNRTLVRWILRNKRRPNSYEDFAATAGVQLPTPPAGKKFVIGKDMRIVLQNL